MSDFLPGYDSWKTNIPDTGALERAVERATDDAEDDVVAEMDNSDVFPTLYDALRAGITREQYTKLWQITARRVAGERAEAKCNVN